MSGDVFNRQFDVVADTRRRWSREEKLAIVTEASGSCVNISAVARRHGIKPALLYRWRKEFGESTKPSVSLVPVVLEDRAPAPKPASVSTCAGGTVEITLANGRTIKVPTSLDAATLKHLLSTIDD